MALTKAQRAAKKEAKRLEKLRKAEELRKKLKLEELRREIKAQDIRKVKIDKQFKEMMAKIKEPEFIKDMEIMQKTFERICDKKDFLIQHTIDLINTANDQSLRLFTNYCQTCDNMIQKFLEELEELSQKNEKRTAAVLQQAKIDEENLKKSQQVTETQLRLLIYYAWSTHETIAWQRRGEFFVKEDEERAMFTNLREDLRSDLEEKYNAIWESYKSTLKSYIVSTTDIQKKVRKLRMKDNVMSEIIAKQAKRINGNDTLVKNLKSELRAYEMGTKQAIFRNRRTRYRNAYIRLRVLMQEERKIDKKQLYYLVTKVTETIKVLESKYKNTVKIIRLMAECRKYETQKEKVLPYGNKEFEPVCLENKAPVRKSQENITDISSPNYDSFMKFWHKVSQADLIKRSLEKEKERLIKENAMIENDLRQKFENEEYSNLKACISVLKDFEPIHTCLQNNTDDDLKDIKEVSFPYLASSRVFSKQFGF